MPPIPLLQIDAFADRPFAGNPAEVWLLDGPAEAVWMQRVAQEMNLSETAFVLRVGGSATIRAHPVARRNLRIRLGKSR